MRVCVVSGGKKKIAIRSAATAFDQTFSLFFFLLPPAASASANDVVVVVVV